MGRRLLTKVPAVDETGAILVNYAAGRVGGAQVGSSHLPSEECVPFSNAPALADRKYWILTFPSEAVYISNSPVSESSAYRVPGAGRGDSYSAAPALSRYSNRKQFLRGQYMHLSLLSPVQVCAKASLSVEDISSLELS